MSYECNCRNHILIFSYGRPQHPESLSRKTFFILL